MKRSLEKKSDTVTIMISGIIKNYNVKKDQIKRIETKFGETNDRDVFFWV